MVDFCDANAQTFADNKAAAMGDSGDDMEEEDDMMDCATFSNMILDYGYQWGNYYCAEGAYDILTAAGLRSSVQNGSRSEFKL